MMNMHRAQLRTAVQRGHGFTGVEQFFLIPGLFNAMKQRELFSIKLDAHLVNFFQSYTMLAGNGTADRHA